MRVEGLGLRVRVQGSGFRVQGFWVQDLGPLRPISCPNLCQREPKQSKTATLSKAIAVRHFTRISMRTRLTREPRFQHCDIDMQSDLERTREANPSYAPPRVRYAERCEHQKVRGTVEVGSIFDNAVLKPRNLRASRT